VRCCNKGCCRRGQANDRRSHMRREGGWCEGCRVWAGSAGGRLTISSLAICISSPDGHLLGPPCSSIHRQNRTVSRRRAATTRRLTCSCARWLLNTRDNDSTALCTRYALIIDWLTACCCHSCCYCCVLRHYADPAIFTATFSCVSSTCTLLGSSVWRWK